MQANGNETTAFAFSIAAIAISYPCLARFISEASMPSRSVIIIDHTGNVEFMRFSFTATALLSLLLFVFAQTAIAQQTSGQEVLDNAAVLTMVHGGVSADLIVRTIRNHPGNYSLSPPTLVRLKQQGIPDKVVNAMLEKSGGDASPPDAATKETLPPPANLPKEWQTRHTKDPLSDAVSNFIVVALPGNPSGSFMVQASCQVESMGFVELRLDIEPVPSQLHFKLSTYTSNATTRATLGGTYQTTPAIERHCAQLGLRIGDGGVAYMESAFCEDDRRAELLFGESEFTSQIMRVSGLRRAGSFRVQMPLTTGVSSVITIPANETFRKFANDCIPPALPPSPKIVYSAGAGRVSSSPIAPHTSDGFIYGNSDTNKSRVFTGNVNQFAVALPAFIDRAWGPAVADGPNKYRAEIAFIVQQLKTCLQITPEVVAGFRHVPNPRTQVDRVIPTGDYGPCLPGRAEGLSAFNVTQQLRTAPGSKGFDQNTERGLSMEIFPNGPIGQNGGYRVHIGFTEMMSDVGYDIQNPENAYKIVDAVIKP